MKAYEVKVHFKDSSVDYTLIVPWMAGFSLTEVFADVLERDDLVSFNLRAVEV